MQTDDVGSILLHFSTTGTYPTEQDAISQELQPDDLKTAIQRLRQERDQTKEEIRALSKTTGPGVESWIKQAKQLQADIQRSKEVASEIVAEHGVVNKLKVDLEDAQGKVVFLEKEVLFEETLAQTLLHIRRLNEQLLDAKESLVRGELKAALTGITNARADVAELTTIKDTKPLSLLRQRGKHVQDSLEEAISQKWNEHFQIHDNTVKLCFEDDGDVEALLQVAEGANILERLSTKLGRDIDRALFTPMLRTTTIGHYATKTSKYEIHVRVHDMENDITSLSMSLSSIVEFISRRMPSAVQGYVLKQVMPRLVSRLENIWLNPSIPVLTAEIPEFEGSLGSLKNFVSQLQSLGLNEAHAIQQWIDYLPKSWLAKRREAVLGDVRQSVFSKFRETHSVERVETEVVKQDDAIAGQVEASTEEDWDVAWDENDDAQPQAASSKTQHSSTVPAEDDDGSAWDVDDAEEPNSAKSGQTDEAWGWEAEGDADKRPKSSEGQIKQVISSGPGEREITLRETYTTTGIPDSIFDTIQRTIQDAQLLASAQFSTSQLAPAATGLYSLPTLALAIYRATAPTACAKLQAGNMMIYNDATRLSEKLRQWQASSPPASQLRLDNDAKSLDLFAKSAYSSEMDAQRTIVRDLLDGAQGFSNCTAQPFKTACEEAIDQIVDRLGIVHRSWNGVLPNSALLQSLGQLLATAISKIIADIEDMSDISEADSHQLKALCDRVTSVRSIFSQQTPTGDVTDMTFIYCPNWLKFQYLVEILESSLADLKYLWNDGELSLEFEPEEVVDLIKALFADSDLRRKAVADIRRQSRR